MGRGFASPAQYRGDDIKPALVSNWRALTTHLNSYVPTFNADGTTLVLPGDLDVTGALTVGTLPTIDHGADVSGLGDDDHTIYTKADGTRAFTGVVTGVAPTADLHLSTKKYVDDQTATTRLYDSTGIVTLASGASWIELTWDTEVDDDLGWHEGVTNPGRITVDRAGIYLIQAQVEFADTNATGYQQLGIFKNGGNRARAAHVSSSNYQTFGCQTVIRAVNTDYFYASVRQNSGSNSTINAGQTASWFAVTLIGP